MKKDPRAAEAGRCRKKLTSGSRKYADGTETEEPSGGEATTEEGGPRISSARRVLAVGTADRSGSRNYIRRGENESTGKRSQGFADQIHEE